MRIGKPKIILAGSSTQAKVYIDLIEQEGRYEIAGLIDPHATGKDMYGYKVFGAEQDLPRLIPEYEIRGCIVAIADNWLRGKVVRLISEVAPNLPFVSVVHPRACVARSARLGPGVVVMPGAIVNADAEIDAHSFLNTGAILEHDCKLGAFASLAPGVTVAGTVAIGDYSAICLGATVLQRLTIGEHSIVGAGAVVTKDIPARSVAYGVPARVVRQRQPGDKYM